MSTVQQLAAGVLSPACWLLQLRTMSFDACAPGNTASDRGMHANSKIVCSGVQSSCDGGCLRMPILFNLCKHAGLTVLWQIVIAKSFVQ